MPGITADNGKISVFGKGAPIVYINNRKVRDMSELERLESSEIATVELITNPGAKYDAEGRAVLLIKTKSKTDGFSAQATERLRQGKYLGDNENISISYTKDKLNLFTTYNHNYRKQAIIENHYYTLKNTNGIWQHTTSLPNYCYSSNSQQFNVGFDFSISDKQAIGGQYQFYNSNHKNTIPINTSTDLNGALYEISQSISETKGKDNHHLVNAFYNLSFNDKYSLRFDFDYLKNYDDQDQHVNETVNNSETSIINIVNQANYDLWAGKLINGYQSDIGLIEFGGEYNYIAGSGFVDTDDVFDNNDFINKEQKAAGFISYSHKIAEFNLTAGLRYEFTSEQFTQGETKTAIIDRTYSDYYPNISLSTKLKSVDLNLAFNKRTKRPNFDQLNGNVLYINRFTFQKGNPYLNKTNIYDVNFQATIKPFYLNVGYTYSKNPISYFFTEQETNMNAILSTSVNFPKFEELNATLNWNSKIVFWQPNYTTGICKPFFSAIYDGQEIMYNRADYFFKIYNDFTMLEGFVLSCNFLYQSDGVQYYTQGKSYKCLDLGVRKSFFNNSLRLNLTVYDIFDWMKEEATVQINNLRWNINKKHETRYATLSISYMFNNYKKKYRGSSAAGDDLNRF